MLFCVSCGWFWLRPVGFFSGEAVSLLHWPQNSVSRWNGFFCHRSHKMSRQFWFLSLRLFVLLALLLLAFSLLGKIFLTAVSVIVIAATILLFLSRSASFLSWRHCARNDLVFYSDDMSTWAFQGSILWRVGSHYLFAIHVGPPNRSTLLHLKMQHNRFIGAFLQVWLVDGLLEV